MLLGTTLVAWAAAIDEMRGMAGGPRTSLGPFAWFLAGQLVVWTASGVAAYGLDYGVRPPRTLPVLQQPAPMQEGVQR